ncbi:MAG: hypothetical protein M1833_005691 [Piccolia ochrophora]|nr:MAG: hypothetical protein M1833_005691 [Piccolia ochrophora]
MCFLPFRLVKWNFWKRSKQEEAVSDGPVRKCEHCRRGTIPFPSYHEERKTNLIRMRRRLTRIVKGAPNEDRSPPPPPTPLDFPRYEPSRTSTPLAQVSPKEFYTLFAGILKPSDIKSEHIESLNLRIERDVAPNDLIPNDGPSHTFLPPADWDAPPKVPELKTDGAKTDTPSTVRLLSNGREAPGEEVYRSRKADLMIDHEDAFRTIERQPPREGREKVKLGHYYKFWNSMDFVAQYWDAPRADEKAGEQVVESSNTPDEMDVDGREQKKKGYQGRRTGVGKEMPEQFREDTVRAFLEPISWLFGCQISQSRMPPRLPIQNSLFPIRLTLSVFRSPTDRLKARQGFCEGPVMGLHSRSETTFREASEPAGAGHMERLDLLREVGVLLLLAHERSRETKSETRPGEGKWYTSAPRWGGGPGGEVGNPASNTDEGGGLKKRQREGKPEGSSRPRSRKESNVEAYRRLAPGMGLWDPKVSYMSIGKVKGSEVDEVFLLSTLNHHVSILRLSIHTAYIDFLETGRVPSPSPPPPVPSHSSSQRQGDTYPWDTLHLRRSKWYDFFKAEDRVEGLRVVWGMMAFLMRSDREGEGDVTMGNA